MGVLGVMKLALVSVMALVACASCDRREESKGASEVPVEEKVVASRPPRPALEPREYWLPLDHELGHYVAKYPGRPILVSISARWSLTSTIGWRVLYSDEATEALGCSGFVCLVGDVTEGDEIGKAAMKELGRVAVPVTAIYDPVKKAWEVKPEVFTAADVREWVASMQRKMAEDGGGLFDGGASE